MALVHARGHVVPVQLGNQVRNSFIQRIDIDGFSIDSCTSKCNRERPQVCPALMSFRKAMRFAARVMSALASRSPELFPPCSRHTGVSAGQLSPGPISRVDAPRENMLVDPLLEQWMFLLPASLHDRHIGAHRTRRVARDEHAAGSEGGVGGWYSEPRSFPAAIAHRHSDSGRLERVVLHGAITCTTP